PCQPGRPCAPRTCQPPANEAMFGPGRGDRVALLTGTPGRALVSGLRAGDVEPVRCHIAWLDAAELLPDGWAPDVAENGAAGPHEALFSAPEGPALGFRTTAVGPPEYVGRPLCPGVASAL